MRWIAGAFLLTALSSCVPLPEQDLDPGEFYSCDDIRKHLNLRYPIHTLNHISRAANSGCHDIVIKYGSKALKKYRAKTYFWSREVASVLVPEGSFIHYVMESHERGFLAFLMSLSYFKRGDSEASQVELRRMDDELRALIYSSGDDPANTLLRAAMWDVHGDTGESWVDWNRLRNTNEVDEAVRTFAARRSDAIDADPKTAPRWRIYSIGTFPEMLWDIHFDHPKRGYFRIRPARDFLQGCASETGLRVSTRSWFSKIATRHSHKSYPLRFAKSWIRLPFGMAYSILNLASGASIIVGGCGVDVAIAEFDRGGELCKISVKGGVAVMAGTPEVLEYVLQPDIRHWDNLPEAFLVTTNESPESEECSMSARGLRRLL